MYCSSKIILNEIPCNSAMEFESVVGNGEVEILENNEKIQGLTYIMNQYVKNNNLIFNEESLNNTTVFKLKVNHIFLVKDLSMNIKITYKFLLNFKYFTLF